MATPVNHTDHELKLIPHNLRVSFLALSRCIGLVQGSERADGGTTVDGAADAIGPVKRIMSPSAPEIPVAAFYAARISACKDPA